MAARPAVKQLVILAGGKGTRLASKIGQALPKPMAPVAGRPLLEHQVELARTHGFEDLRLLTSHRSEVIEDHFGDGSRFGISIGYHLDSVPRGTAGAVLEALPELADRFALLYGDTLLDVDLDRFWRRHEEVGADASLFVHPNDHPYDSDLVATDDESWIQAFHAHPHPEGKNFRNLVNAALYIVDKHALAPWADSEEKLDFAHDLFPRMLEEGNRLYAYHSREYIKDMGTPDRLARVEGDLVSGKVERLAMRNACPAVFLDRDGTLNVEVNRVSAVDQLEMIDGVGEAVRRINRAGMLSVVVTNQPVIARGDCDEAELRDIHDKLETLLGVEGAYVDAIYHCPHHPDRGFEGERPELKIACDCRKPATGMIERATADLFVDRAGSWMIGDTTTDLQTARTAGLRSVLLRTGHAGRDRRHPVLPDYEFHDLTDAALFVTSEHAAYLQEARTTLPACAPGSLVAIGGLARSGKSIHASIFREVLAERGQQAVIVPLDAWLRSKDEREPGHVLGRFDIAGIEELVRRLVGRTRATTVHLRRYDRDTQKCDEDGAHLEIEPDDVVLFEGVPALLNETLVAAAGVSLYVTCPENVRRARFAREYRSRGASDEEIEALYREREVDEHPFVKASADMADVRIGSET